MDVGNVDIAGANSVHADSDAVVAQHPGKAVAGKLRALVGIKVSGTP